MGVKAVYYNGIRLWQVLKHWKPSSQRTAQSRKVGLSRALALQNPRSPNFIYEISVHTAVEPASSLGDISRQEHFNLQMASIQKALIGASTREGYLTWVMDTDYKFNPTSVINPGAFPGVATVNYGGGTPFIPASGQYLLLRNPTTGAGFVGLASGTGGAGPASINVQVQAAIDTGWQVFLSVMHFPNTVFDGVGGWETATQAEDRYAFDVAYLFSSTSHIVHATAYTPTIT